MRNIERQKMLDKKKWIASEKNGFDMSGDMLPCNYCDKQTPSGFQSNGYYKHGCTVTQEEREKYCLCAVAYNRMEKRKRRV